MYKPSSPPCTINTSQKYPKPIRKMTNVEHNLEQAHQISTSQEGEINQKSIIVKLALRQAMLAKILESNTSVKI
jgi:hypothetical protein